MWSPALTWFRSAPPASSASTVSRFPCRTAKSSGVSPPLEPTSSPYDSCRLSTESAAAFLIESAGLSFAAALAESAFAVAALSAAAFAGLAL